MNVLYPQLANLGRHLILMAVIALSGNALAESAEDQDLRPKAEVLKKQVHESKPIQTPKSKKVTGNRWHALQVNMSKAEVSSLLGKPGRIDKWKTGEAWYFPNSKGGEVDFDANGKVSGWLAP